MGTPLFHREFVTITISGPRPVLECVHASGHVIMPTWVLNSASSPMHSDMETWVSVCGTVYVAVISFLFPHLVRMWTCITTCIIVHLTPHACSILLCLVIWKDGFLCLALYVSSNHSTCGPTSWIEGVHASIHVLLSTWLPMSASPRLHTYMERWVPLYGTVCVFQSSASGPMPCLKCAHASVHYFMSLPECTCLFHPIWRVSWKHGCPCVTLGVWHNQPISGCTQLC